MTDERKRISKIALIGLSQVILDADIDEFGFYKLGLLTEMEMDALREVVKKELGN